METRKISSGYVSLGEGEGSPEVYFRAIDAYGVENSHVKVVVFLYGYDYDVNPDETSKFIPRVITSIINKLGVNGFKTRFLISKTPYSLLISGVDKQEFDEYKLIRFAWDNDDKVAVDYKITVNS